MSSGISCRKAKPCCAKPRSNTSSHDQILLQVAEKEEEKAMLLTMCNELVNKLEKEGISL